jgi:tetratricopeptide (TPR) repeat protein
VARLIARALACACLLAPLVARAEGADADPSLAVAKSHFERGALLYRQQRYEEAIVDFEAARQAHPSPALDYNIGRAAERLERWDLAVASYQRYLDAVGPAEEQDLRSRMDILRQHARHGLAPSAPAEPHAATPIYRRWWLWTLVAVAAIGAGVAVGFAVAQQPAAPGDATLGTMSVTFR